jgi:(R)-1-hydroxy-2-aminoethylphosphonate ammonia-lyase
VGGEAIFRQNIGPLMPGTEHVPPANEYRCLWDCDQRDGCDLKCARYIEYILEKEGDIAAVIAEPIRSTPYIPTAEYWQAVRRACDKHGTLLIFDEIPHGLGRTGEMFTCINFDVVPDILVIGKGLGGGIFPMAAMIAREDLNLVADRALGHFTHEKNPVACATALATLDYIEANNLPQQVKELGHYALERLRTMMSHYDIIGDVRGLGLMLGIELVRDRQTKERAVDEAEEIMYMALSRGLNFKVSMGNILTLIPPLTITRNELKTALDIIEDCIVAVNKDTRAN